MITYTKNNKRDYGRFFAICKAHKFEYKDKVAEYTGTHCKTQHDSLSTLSDDEYVGLMILMIEVNKGLRTSFTPKEGDKQRKKLIGMALTMFWGRTTEEAVDAIERWIIKQKFKKPLMRHTPNELNLIIAIFEQRVDPHYTTTIRK